MEEESGQHKSEGSSPGKGPGVPGAQAQEQGQMVTRGSGSKAEQVLRLLSYRRDPVNHPDRAEIASGSTEEPGSP